MITLDTSLLLKVFSLVNIFSLHSIVRLFVLHLQQLLNREESTNTHAAKGSLYKELTNRKLEQSCIYCCFQVVEQCLRRWRE